MSTGGLDAVVYSRKRPYVLSRFMTEADTQLGVRPPTAWTRARGREIACRSVMDLCQQTGNDLHLFLSVLVLLAFDLGSLCATLLLRLARFHPLFHCQVLTQTSQIVILQAEAIEQRAVGDGVQDDVVVRSVETLVSDQCNKFAATVSYLAKKSTPRRSTWAWSSGGE